MESNKTDINRKVHRSRLRGKQPLEIMVYFVLAAITSLFVGLTFAYLFSKQPEWSELNLPKIFWLSTVFVVASSVIIERAWQCFLQDDPGGIVRYTLFTAALGMVFLVCQAIGLYELIEAGFPLGNGAPAGSYIHLLAWTHGIHLLVGLGLVAALAVTAAKLIGHPVKALLYFADDNKRARFRSVRLYWHLIGVIWGYLFLFFLFHHS